MEILVVEDEPTIAGLLQESLSEDLNRVVWVDSLSAGRAQIAERKFDLALVDILLPDGRGTELKSLAQQRGVRIILMSGATDSENIARAAALPLLKKPFLLSTLFRAIAENDPSGATAA